MQPQEPAQQHRRVGGVEVRQGQLLGEQVKAVADRGDAEAEATLLKSYEYDAGNPVVAFNIAKLMSQRGDNRKAQFYVRRLNNGELANSESLYLGIKIEEALGDRTMVRQLASQLQRRFPDSKEWARVANGGVL